MHDNGTDVVRVGFEGGNLLGCVVVVDAELEVIAATHNPVLAGDEATRSYGNIGQFKRLDDCLCFVRPDVDVAAVERGEDLKGGLSMSCVLPSLMS